MFFAEKIELTVSCATILLGRGGGVWLVVKQVELLQYDKHLWVEFLFIYSSELSRSFKSHTICRWYLFCINSLSPLQFSSSATVDSMKYE